jgi:Fur family ferric uptake transcriptional regulator
MILEIMQNHRGHVSAEEVYQSLYVAHPYINRSTIYRTLEMLTKEGVLTVTDLGTGPVSYELNTGEPHHHLVCENCGKIEEFDHELLQSLRQALKRKYQFQARLDHMAIFGLCGKCRANTSKAQQTRKR